MTEPDTNDLSPDELAARVLDRRDHRRRVPPDQLPEDHPDRLAAAALKRAGHL